MAKEFSTGAQEGLFAATPPLEAVRLLISDAATVSNACPRGDRVIMVSDVARAFFEAPMKRTVCVELPQEARVDGASDDVGLLQKSLYGTRDAAATFKPRLEPLCSPPVSPSLDIVRAFFGTRDGTLRP